MKSLALNLSYYRKLAGISEKDLANLVNVSPATIKNYESGNTLPTMDMVIRLAHILNITTDQLLGYSIPQK